MVQKNVPGWERVLRGAIGMAGVVIGVMMAVTGYLLWGLIVAASGAGLAATALAGWCPLCAMVGRTLPHVDKKIKVARL